jgi:hypothetical protein
VAAPLARTQANSRLNTRVKSDQPIFSINTMDAVVGF